jgi:prolyl-tRNA editing enzyme YbaK/EbsC (Cys-tRNA(Pro) deacylase)
VRTSVDVHNFLTEREVPHEVFPAKGRLRSAERMAAVLDLPPADVGRIVVFEGDTAAVAAVVPSDRHPDAGLVGAATGQDSLKEVSGGRASKLTGYLPESIPPAGLPDGILIVLDRSLYRDRVLYFPGGEARLILKVRGKDLARATSARVARIAPVPKRGT